MKIISFAVNNFRSINGGLENNKITFEGSNTIFIFGQNNVGKSTFLKAYSFFVKDDKPEIIDFYNQDEGNQIEIEIEIEIEQKDENLIGESDLSGYRDFISRKNEKNRIRVRRLYSGTKKTDSKFQTLNSQSGEWDNGQSFGLGTVFGSVLPKPIFIKAMPNESDVKTTLNEILKLKAEKKLKIEDQVKLSEARKTIKLLQDEIYGVESIQNYQDRVNEEFHNMFPELSFEIKDNDRIKFTHDKIGRDFDITCLNSKNNKTGENDEKVFNLPNDLLSNGHGTVRSAIFTFLMLQDEVESESLEYHKDVIILFEEPELFLHPKLTRQLRELMYKISKEGTEFQILCASHSPQMIDISKDHTSLVRMVQNLGNSTELHQVKQEDLVDSNNRTIDEVREELHQILRFNPFICESFYADEVILVEGDTEAIILRAYLEKFGDGGKDIFVVNCGSVTNIPFYQKIFSKFRIKYSVVCDTDHIKYKKNMERIPENIENENINGWNFDCECPSFNIGIQKSIQEQFEKDAELGIAKFFKVFAETFEPAHKNIDEPFKYEGYSKAEGKPYGANKYWEKIVKSANEKDFGKIPIISYIKIITVS